MAQLGACGNRVAARVGEVAGDEHAADMVVHLALAPEAGARRPHMRTGVGAVEGQAHLGVLVPVVAAVLAAPRGAVRGVGVGCGDEGDVPVTLAGPPLHGVEGALGQAVRLGEEGVFDRRLERPLYDALAPGAELTAGANRAAAAAVGGAEPPVGALLFGGIPAATAHAELAAGRRVARCAEVTLAVLEAELPGGAGRRAASTLAAVARAVGTGLARLALAVAALDHCLVRPGRVRLGHRAVIGFLWAVRQRDRAIMALARAIPLGRRTVPVRAQLGRRAVKPLAIPRRRLPVGPLP